MSKGVRVQTTFRLPVDLHRAAAAQARSRRQSLNDYLVAAVRNSIPVPVAEPVEERQNIGVYNDNGERVGVQ